MKQRRVIIFAAFSILAIAALYFGFRQILFNKENLIQLRVNGNERSHDEVLANIEGDRSSIQHLEKVFGEGRQYIRHYQTGFDDSVLVWEAKYQERFTVQYEIPLVRSPDGLVVAQESKEVGLFLENIHENKLPDGRIKITHGRSFEFRREDLLKWSSVGFSLSSFPDE